VKFSERVGHWDKKQSDFLRVVWNPLEENITLVCITVLSPSYFIS